LRTQTRANIRGWRAPGTFARANIEGWRPPRTQTRASIEGSRPHAAPKSVISTSPSRAIRLSDLRSGLPSSCQWRASRIA
jgi:hypothetical protein